MKMLCRIDLELGIALLEKTEQIYLVGGFNPFEKY